MNSLRNPHLKNFNKQRKNTRRYHSIVQHSDPADSQRKKDRDPFSRHILPPFPAGTSTVLCFPWELAVITAVFLYPNLQRSRPDSPLLHAHGNIFWSVARHQPAHKLINPTCLTTTCQALHQRRSVAAAKGQRFSNSRGAGA